MSSAHKCSVWRSFPWFTQQQSVSFHQDCIQYENIPMWPSQREEGTLLQKKCVFKKCYFPGSLRTVEFDPWFQFTMIPHHINSEGDKGKKQDRAVETCRLPFTFAEECWQFLALLSVCGQDKSPVFINKIDDIAYHQFLFCVFPYRLYSAQHLLWLRSYPLWPSPGTLRCFNIFHIGFQNAHSSRCGTALPRFIDIFETSHASLLCYMRITINHACVQWNWYVLGSMKSARHLIT